MATTLTTTLKFVLDTIFTDDLDLTDPRDTLSANWNDTLANGTAINEADVIWHDRRTAAGAPDDIDLVGNAAFVDAFGNTITFAKIKGIFIHNRNTTAGHNLAIGGDVAPFANWVSDAASDIVNVGPNGKLLLWSPIDGYACAGGSDILQIDPGADTIIYDIVLIGTSA